MKRTASIILCIVAVLLLVSCGNKSVTFTYNEENLLVGDDGELYKYAPFGAYEPTDQGEEYGVIKSVRTQKVYRIGDADPKEWITTEYSGGTTYLFYDSEITLPTLDTIDPELCYICIEDEAVFSVYTLGSPDNKRMDEEKADIDAVINMLTDDSVEGSMYPLTIEESYSLKLYSEKWPAIYYCLEYMKNANGNFVYDPISKKCVDVGDIIEGYIGDAE